jgi:3(or 17)beta-hydroxysteroid dehydrogenase
MNRVAGKIAIVTGVGSGIGRAGALALAREGAALVATDIAAEGAEATAAAIRDLGGKALALRHDVGEEADWASVIAATMKEFGRLDVLVNNAGIGVGWSLVETSLADWRRLMRVNLDGVFLGTREAVRVMRPKDSDPAAGLGSIVNLSSVAGLVGSVELTCYSASKGAVRLFTKSAALECAAKGWRVRVNSIHPGLIATPMGESLVTGRAAKAGIAPAAMRAQLEMMHPLGRLGAADDIANGIVYLASEESSFMTGAELVIDGGYTAR